MKKVSETDVATIIYIFLVWVFKCLNPMLMEADILFLDNRMTQVRNCILDGNLPFFYYNDFLGVGYGNSFFYGDLTITPFAFLFEDSNIRMKIFILVTLVLLTLGVRTFTKRFTNNYKFISFMFLGTFLITRFILNTYLIANIYAIAIGLFFLSYCVDFFRDNKSSTKASILFFLLMNTHLVTSIICFIGCVCIFIYYYNKERWKEYIRFALRTCLICSYIIVNMLYHADIIGRTKDINLTMLESGGISQFTLTFGGFGGVLIRTLTEEYKGFGIANLITMGILIVLLVKYKYTIKNKIVLLGVFISLILSQNIVWVSLFKVIDIPIQFPIRFLPFTILVLYVIILRKVDSKKLSKTLLIITCLEIISLLILSISTDGEKKDRTFNYIGNGEYLSTEFVMNKVDFELNSNRVIDNTGKEYNYRIEDEKLIIEIDNITKDTVIQAPKLWYKGYVCYALVDNKPIESSVLRRNLDVTQGKGQWCNIRVSHFSGEIVLEYIHPYWLQILWVFTGFIVVYLIIMEITRTMKYYKQIKGR